MASTVNSDDGDDGRVTVLTFDLAAERYCVDADSVASVLGVTDDRAIATADDPWNAGTVSVAGERVRVIDFPRAFHGTASTTTRVDDPKLLVLAVDGVYVGWLVDDVDVTRTVSAGGLEPTRSGVHIPHVRGSLEIDGERVIWLDERTIHD